MKNLELLMKNVNPDKLIFVGEKEKDVILRSIHSTRDNGMHNLNILIEELAELIQAITKNVRKKFDYLNMAEEIADVMICSEYLYIVCEIDKVFVIEKACQINFDDLDLNVCLRYFIRLMDLVNEYLIERNNVTIKELEQAMINSMIGIYFLIHTLNIKKIDIDVIKELKYLRLESILTK